MKDLLSNVKFLRVFLLIAAIAFAVVCISLGISNYAAGVQNKVLSEKAASAETLQETVGMLEEQNESLTDDLAQAQAELETVTAEKASLTAEHDALTRKHAELEQAYEALRTEQESRASEELAAKNTEESSAAAVQAAAEPSEPSGGRTVYYTRTGSKYHYANPCGNGTYYPCSLEEALARGLDPCGKCVG